MNASIIQTAIESHDPDLAKQALRQADVWLGSTLDPNERVYLLFSKSSCYGILGDFKKAREQLSLALQQQPHDPDTRLTFEFNEGLLDQEEGNYGEALERLSSVLSRYADPLKHPEWRFLYEDIQQRRAFLSVAIGEFKHAIPVLTEVLSFDLEDGIRSDALAGLGRCYLEMHSWALAKDCFLQAMAIGLTEERERHSHFYLGIACFHTGALIEAKREFEICEEHSAEFQLPILDVYRWLACVSEQLGETAESERYRRLARTV